MGRFATLTFCCFVSFFFGACARPLRMEGDSMLPAIKNGDRFFVTQPGIVSRGDIVVFRYPKDETKSYLKRVIGLPGETIEVKQGKVFINDKELDEPYVDPQYIQGKKNCHVQTVPEASYYVLGDNRDNSSDSCMWGTVKKDLITGNYYATYFSPGEK